MRPELIVAGKEFRDHVTSRRFIVIFAILLLFSIYAIVSGMDQYNKVLDSYKQSQYSYVPSVMSIFYQMNQYFVWICALLATALGFDLITREKEEGSLKSLLSHPIYRDSVINGKALGAIGVLTAAMGATLLITIAIVLFFGVVPSLDELLRIAAYFGAALLLSLAFFAVAMAASTLARNSSMAVLYALGIVVVLVGLASFSYQIVSLVVGPAPDYGGPIVYASGGSGAGTDLVKADLVWSNGTGVSAAEGSPPPDVSAVPTRTPEPILPGEPGGSAEWRQWEERQQLVQGALNAISPITNFQYVIANALVSDTSSWIGPLPIDAKYASYAETAKKNVGEALGSVWINIVVLLAETLAAFAVAYVKFLRSDIR